MPPAKAAPKRRLHIDKRAGSLATAAAAVPQDAIINTKQLAAWLGVSKVWIENGRTKGGYGPPFSKENQIVRYRCADVIEWLKSRELAPEQM